MTAPRWVHPESFDWEREANCATADPEVFFPEKGHGSRPATELCARCWVQPECLARALVMEAGLTRHFRAGIWGGCTPAERVALDRSVA